MAVPSPADVLLVVQLAGSMPEPPASVQFHVTVTSVLFQPATALGDCVGPAVGANASITVTV